MPEGDEDKLPLPTEPPLKDPKSSPRTQHPLDDAKSMPPTQPLPQDVAQEILDSISKLRTNLGGMYQIISSRWRGQKYDFLPGATMDEKLEVLRDGLSQLTCDMLVIGSLFEDVSHAFEGISSILRIAPQIPIPLEDVLVFTRMLQELYVACGNEWTNLRGIAAEAAPGASTSEDIREQFQTLKEEMRREMRSMLPDLAHLSSTFAAAQQGSPSNLADALSSAAQMTQEGGAISREEGDSMMSMVNNLDTHSPVPPKVPPPRPTLTVASEGVVPGMGPRVPTAEEVLETLSGVSSRLNTLDADVKRLQEEVKHQRSGEFIEEYLQRLGISTASLQEMSRLSQMLRASSAPPAAPGAT